MNDVLGGLRAASHTTQLPPVTVSSRDGTGAGGIRHAAANFESLLLNQWLQGAEATFGSVPGADDDEDGADAQMKEFAVQALARGMVTAGGIGLSAMVEHGLSKSQENREVSEQSSFSK